VDGERGQGPEPRACPFPVQVLSAVGAQHNRAAEMGPTRLHTWVRGNIIPLNQAFRLPCLVPCVALGQPGRKIILTSLQGFSISSSLQLRN